MTSTRVRGVRRPWTLRRRLVISLCGLVMAVLLMVGGLTRHTLSASLTTLVDDRLDASLAVFESEVVKHRDPAKPSEVRPLTAFTGQAPDTLIVLLRDGAAVDSALFSDHDATPAPAEVIRQIENRPWTSAGPQTVELAGLGDFRLRGQSGPSGELLVSGVSMARADQAIKREEITVAGLTLVALLVTAIGTILIVRVALRPLARVAATASDVATVPLGRGNHATTPRVDERDTDARTEVGLVGHTLNRLLDHVDHAFAERVATDRRMRQFITDASHELRTPLAAIQGYAELTRQDSADLPETTEYSLARIEAEAKRMNSLVADLLLLARLDEGHDIENLDVDLSAIVVDAVNDAAVSAPDHRWLTNVDERAVVVRGDAEKIHQLLANLLSNARVHTPDGTTVTTGIATRTSENGAVYAELTVSDDGPGIDAKVLPHLFERFVRADKSRSSRYGSNGLGLSIAAAIVAAHGGSITAESEPGRTAFCVRLPIGEPSDEALAQSSSEADSPTSRASTTTA